MRAPFEEMDYKPTPENVFQGEYKEERLRNRRVICAACKLDGLILAGARHFDTVMATQIEHLGAGLLFLISFNASLYGSLGSMIIDWGTLNTPFRDYLATFYILRCYE